MKVMYKFGMLARLRSNPRCLSLLVRSFSNNGSKFDIDKLLGDVLNKDETQILKKRLEKIDRDTYKQAMSSQLPEMGYQADQLMRRMPRPGEQIPPSRSALLRQNTFVIRTLRSEVYNRAISEGLDKEKASRIAAQAVERADEIFKQKTDQTMEDIKREADKLKAEQDQMNGAEQRLMKFASRRIQELFDPTREQRSGKTYIAADPTAPHIFGNTEVALNIFDTKELTPIPTSYWAKMERRKAEVANQAMGPINAFEEQIQWTEQGRMWPYPIDNEYLLGEEHNVHFSEHIFLDRYLAKHTHLPKTGPIAHFMELVCVGLSKNPYMTLEKKHMHLDSFAEFFNPEQIKKVHRMHEEAEKQAT